MKILDFDREPKLKQIMRFCNDGSLNSYFGFDNVKMNSIYNVKSCVFDSRIARTRHFDALHTFDSIISTGLKT